uniref:Uncharacterized protein n=1 Tax=Knipowitschia caucasica TaxID=637954 RepID=A0AAV2JYA1_KNICA
MRSADLLPHNDGFTVPFSHVEAHSSSPRLPGDFLVPVQSVWSSKAPHREILISIGVRKPRLRKDEKTGIGDLLSHRGPSFQLVQLVTERLRVPKQDGWERGHPSAVLEAQALQSPVDTSSSSPFAAYVSSRRIAKLRWDVWRWIRGPLREPEL